MAFRQSLPSNRLCSKGQTRNKLTIQQVKGKGYMEPFRIFFFHMYTKSLRKEISKSNLSNQLPY